MLSIAFVSNGVICFFLSSAFATAYKLHGLSSALTKDQVNQLSDLVVEAEVMVEVTGGKVKVSVEGQDVLDILKIGVFSFYFFHC